MLELKFRQIHLQNCCLELYFTFNSIGYIRDELNKLSVLDLYRHRTQTVVDLKYSMHARTKTANKVTFASLMSVATGVITF